MSVTAESDDDDAESAEDLQGKLMAALNDCSRQRLRAMKMTLHKRANVDTRVSFKDLAQVLQVRELRIGGSRIFLERGGDFGNPSEH